MENISSEEKKSSFLGALFHGTMFYVFMVVIVAGLILGFKFYMQEKNIEVVTSNTTNLKLGDMITFRFSTKMLERSVEESMSIQPSLRVRTAWSDSRILTLTLLEAPLPETTYEIIFDEAKTQFYVPQEKIKRKISSSVVPKLKNVYPSNEQKDVDINDQITIDFDQTIEDPFKIEVKVVPMTTNFNYKFNESNTQLVITPELKMEKKTEYLVTIQLRHNNLDFSRELYQGKFTTKPPPQVFYNYGGNNLQTKTEDRLEEVEPQIVEGDYIDIDLSSQTMFIFESGKEKGAFKVSSGKIGMDTPQGTFSVMAKAKRPWSKEYGLYMPWFIQFTNRGHGIHELPEWPSGYKEGTNHLGIPVSHGCVRLGIGPAKTVYDFAAVGMPIIIHK